MSRLHESGLTLKTPKMALPRHAPEEYHSDQGVLCGLQLCQLVEDTSHPNLNGRCWEN
jgi:hypothetical protein